MLETIRSILHMLTHLRSSYFHFREQETERQKGFKELVRGRVGSLTPEPTWLMGGLHRTP